MRPVDFTKNKIDSAGIDTDLFRLSCDKIIGKSIGEDGIGTLGEKTVHAVLKYYYVPDKQYHEIHIGNYVADICREGEIYEIQSKAFYTMKSKLDFFLSDYEVTIVYPVPLTKYLRWIDPETGEISSTRKSSKRGHIYDIVPELYSIREFLGHENLHFILCFIEMEEYKLLDGYGKDHKKHATKTDRIPTKLIGEFYLNEISDFKKLLPNHLPEQFTTKDIAEYAGCSADKARYLLALLQKVNIIKQVGNKSRYHLYSVLE